MKHIKEFEEYLDEGIAKKQTPDPLRAKSLVEESDEAYDILKSYIKNMGITDKNANHLIKNAYDILMELVRANMHSKGFSSSGKGGHEAEVSFLRTMRFSENDVEFADTLRYFRNGILYYGKKLGKEYAQKVLGFLDKIYPALKKRLP